MLNFSCKKMKNVSKMKCKVKPKNKTSAMKHKSGCSSREDTVIKEHKSSRRLRERAWWPVAIHHRGVRTSLDQKQLPMTFFLLQSLPPTVFVRARLFSLVLQICLRRENSQRWRFFSPLNLSDSR